MPYALWHFLTFLNGVMMLNITGIKQWVIEQVLWVENNLKGKSGAEKRAAVIKKLDDMVTLPAYLEWADDIVIGMLVDRVCSKLNEITEHNFSNIKLNEEQKKQLAEEIKEEQ